MGSGYEEDAIDQLPGSEPWLFCPQAVMALGKSLNLSDFCFLVFNVRTALLPISYSGYKD